MLVLGCCQDCELLIKQLSLTLASRKYLKQGGRTCRSGGIVLKLFKFLLVHTVCTSCSIENCFSESLVLFYFSFHILEFKSFVWIWSVWKCSMKCLLYVSYDSRGTKKYCCRSEQWPASSYVQLLGYWKMYKKWISDSASAVFMTGMFLKEFSLNVIILLLPLKSDWIFHLNEITFPFL